MWWSIWVSCGRPRDGVIFNIYKDLKKRFRQVCRYNVNNTKAAVFSTLNHLYKARKMKAFWNKLSYMQRNKINSAINEEDMASYYTGVMYDASPSNDIITKTVDNKAKSIENCHSTINVTPQDVYEMIHVLNRGVSPGCDGITVEHLIHGMSSPLCKLLADLYSIILSYSLVPTIFKMGIIIPILKKPTLDCNNVVNYRPITLSSVFF